MKRSFTENPEGRQKAEKDEGWKFILFHSYNFIYKASKNLNARKAESPSFSFHVCNALQWIDRSELTHFIILIMRW